MTRKFAPQLTYRQVLANKMRSSDNAQGRSLTIRDLARLTTFSYEHTRKLVSGEASVSRDFNDRICRVVGLNPDHMWDLVVAKKMREKQQSLANQMPIRSRIQRPTLGRLVPTTPSPMATIPPESDDPLPERSAQPDSPSLMATTGRLFVVEVITEAQGSGSVNEAYVVMARSFDDAVEVLRRHRSITGRFKVCESELPVARIAVHETTGQLPEAGPQRP